MAYGSSGADAQKQRRMENQRQQRIAEGKSQIDARFAGFDDNFFNRRAQDYEAFAVPQLTQQYDKTRKDLTYSLASRGLMNSSAAADRGASLERELGQRYRDVADTGAAQANQLRLDVEKQRGNLLGQVEASADPAGAGAQAVRTAAAYSQPTSFAPIGNFFADWTRNYLANQTARTYDPQVQPLFGFAGQSAGSDRIVR